MRTTLILAALAMAPLAGCANKLTNVNSAGSIAAASADDLYRHASAAGEALVKAGVIDKAKFKADDAKAYAILVGIRAGTSTLTELNTAIAAMLETVK